MKSNLNNLLSRSKRIHDIFMNFTWKFINLVIECKVSKRADDGESSATILALNTI